jgi:Uri superfamily endonuclease
MKGTYILVILIPENIDITIGALGRISFEKGTYLYVGSGMGTSSAALEIRVNRHLKLSTQKKAHWHIDYLLNHKGSIISKVFLIPSSNPLECVIAKELNNVSDIIINKFGSSDCKCKSHLFYVKHF